MFEQIRQEALATGCYIFWKDPKKELPTRNCQKVLIYTIEDGEAIEGTYCAGDRFYANDDAGEAHRVFPIAWAEWPKFNGVFVQ